MALKRTVELIKAGQQFGRWTAKEDQQYSFTKKLMCECACGTQRMALVENLRAGRSKSCGCINKEVLRASAAKRRKHHLSPGDVYGRLTVVDATDYTKVKCACVCGNTTFPTASALYGSNTRSCGCLHRDNAIAMGKRHQSAGGFSEHTLYGTWQRKVLSSEVVHEPWRTNATLFIKEVEAEIGPRPKGLWFRLRNEQLGVVPGNIFWGARGLNKGQKVHLTADQKREIVRMVEAGTYQYEVARLFNVSASLVSSVCRDPRFVQ